MANAVRMEMKSTCRMSPEAKALKNVGDDVQQESDRVLMPAFLDVGGELVGIGRADGAMEMQARKFARFPYVHHHQAEDQREGRDDLEINQRPDADAPEFFEVAHRGDAMHHRAENDWRDDQFHQLDEAVAERFQAHAEPGLEMPDRDADGDGDQHLDVKHADTRASISKGGGAGFIITVSFFVSARCCASCRPCLRGLEFLARSCSACWK